MTLDSILPLSYYFLSPIQIKKILDLNQGFKLLEELHKLNHSPILFNFLLDYCHYEGRGTICSINCAWKSLEKPLKEGFVPALYYAGLCLKTSTFGFNLNEALFKKAAEQEYEDAMWDL